MNPFMLPSPERIEAWSEFRDALPTMPEMIQLNKVANYWAKCPFSKWTLDPENPKEWVSVWEMLNEGDYCRNAIAIGMESTLRWSGVEPSRLKLSMIKKIEDGDEFFVLIIDNKFVLNYSYDEVVKVETINDQLKYMYTYQWKSRSYRLTT